MARQLEHDCNVRLATVQEAINLELNGIDLLIVGSPTRGFRPTPQMSEYLEGLDRVHGATTAAVFDTRIDLETVHPAALKWVVEAEGYAADRMDQMLQHRAFLRKGGLAGFLVTGTEGPLKAGEIERALEWANTLVR